MKRESGAKKTRRSLGGRLHWTVGCLLLCTLVSFWLVCGLFAKYTTSGVDDDTGRVAKTGVVDFRVLEHKAVNVSSVDPMKVYELLDGSTDDRIDDNRGKLEEVTGNTYETIPPGYDIPKDPFVRLELKNSEVDYYLYVKVIKPLLFPETVTFELDDENWQEFDAKAGIYKFIGDTDTGIRGGYIDAGTLERTDIYILKDNRIEVGQFYDGTLFTVSFEAYLVQVD